MMHRIILNSILLSAFLCVCLVFSLTLFSGFNLQWIDLVGTLISYNEFNIKHQVLLDIRLPRTLCVVLIGANLSITGAILQGITRNPLASPTLFGVNAGCAAIMAISSGGFFHFGGAPFLLSAVGGFLGGLLTLMVGGFFSRKDSMLKIVLAGIAVNGLLVSITRAFIIISDESSYGLMKWLVGSFSNLNWGHWDLLWQLSMLGYLGALLVAKNINLLALGEDAALKLGVNVSATYVIAFLTSLLLVAVSTSIAGPIAFLGLIIPHIARCFVGENQLTLIPVCAFVGACSLLLADTFSRLVQFPAETPAGILVALVGGCWLSRVSLWG